jgi:hypothetical protein
VATTTINRRAEHGGSQPETLKQHGEDQHAWFRVTYIGINPVAAVAPQIISASDQFMLTVQYGRNGRTYHYGLPADWCRDYLDTANEAINSGQTYWVDLNFDRPGSWPKRLDETVLTRIIAAIKNGQVVPANALNTEPLDEG